MSQTEQNRSCTEQSADGPQISLDDFCDILEKMTCTITASTILALDGAWGSGKTHLLKLWVKKLRDENRPFVYYNAWDNDHGDSPFISLGWALEHQLPEKLKQTEIWQKTISLGKALSNTFGQFDVSSPMPLISFGSFGLATPPVPLVKGLGKQEDLPENKIDAYFSKQAGFKALRSHFAEFADLAGKQWMEDNPGKQDSQPPLVIFFDELDRCHPDFIDNILELVKSQLHFPHMLFVFAVSVDHIRERVKSIYGSGMDTEAYLRRVFDHIIPLPLPSNNQGLSFCRHLLNKLNVKSKPLTEIGSTDLAEEFFRIVCKLNITLREQHQTAVIADLIARAYPEGHWSFICCLVCLRLRYRKYFDFFRNKSFNFMKLQDILHWDKDARKDPALLLSERLLGHVFGCLLHYCHDSADWAATQAEIARYAKNHEPIGLDFYKALATATDDHAEELEKLMMLVTVIMK